MKSYLHLIWHNLPMLIYASEWNGGNIWNFQNTFDRSCDEIRLDIQSKKCLRKSNLNEINTL